MMNLKLLIAICGILNFQIAFGQDLIISNLDLFPKEVFNKFPNLKIGVNSSLSPNWTPNSVDFYLLNQEEFLKDRDKAKEIFWEGFAISSVSGTIAGIVTASILNAITNIGREEPQNAPIIKGAITGLGIGTIVGLFVGWGRSNIYKSEQNVHPYPILN